MKKLLFVLFVGVFVFCGCDKELKISGTTWEITEGEYITQLKFYDDKNCRLSLSSENNLYSISSKNYSYTYYYPNIFMNAKTTNEHDLEAIIVSDNKMTVYIQSSGQKIGDLYKVD